MADQTVNIDFTGSAGGLIGAINDSLSAMKKMETQSKSFADSIVASVKSQIMPIAGALATAFAVNKALKAFSASDLPGAKEYREQIESTEKSLKTLAEVVGEFLAPAALMTSKAIQYIADKLAPLIRIISAFVASSKPFLLQLGQNILEAFRPLLPTVAAFVDRIVALFSGGGNTDWQAVFDKIRAYWNNTWSAILDFTAPIIAALSDLVETVIDVAGVAFHAIWEVLQGWLGTGQGLSINFQEIADIIQFGILVGISAVNIAIRNWPDTIAVVVAAFNVAWAFLSDGAVKVVDYLTQAFDVLGPYLVEVFEVATDKILGFFERMWHAILVDAKVATSQLAFMIQHPIKFATMNSDQWKLLTRMFRIGAEASTAGATHGGKEFPGVPGLPAAPAFGNEETDKALEEFDAITDKLRKIFGDAMPKAIEDALERGKEFAERVRKGLPDVVAEPKDRVSQPATAGRALLFGTAEAFLKEHGGADASLEEQKKTNGILERIEKDGKQKGKGPKPVNIGK